MSGQPSTGEIRGFRVEPVEVEAALAAKPAVARAAVAARDDGPGGQRLVAYVVPTPGAEPGRSPFRAHLVASLPEYMVPAAYVVLETLPLNSHGKLDRRGLPGAEDSGDPTPSGTYMPPRSPAEVEMAAIWSEVLRRRSASRTISSTSAAIR